MGLTISGSVKITGGGAVVQPARFPSSPIVNSVTYNDIGSVTVGWSQPTDAGTWGICGYVVTAFPTANSVTVPSKDITNATLTGLSTLTLYSFQVTPYNYVGGGDAGSSPCIAYVGSSTTALAAGASSYVSGPFTWFKPAGVTSVSVVVVGSGGGGSTCYRPCGSAGSSSYFGTYAVAGGGGAGGLLTSSSYSLAAGSYNITIGSGGAGGTSTDTNAPSGNNTLFSSFTAFGGGGGGKYARGARGGCGGGGG